LDLKGSVSNNGKAQRPIKTKKKIISSQVIRQIWTNNERSLNEIDVVDSQNPTYRENDFKTRACPSQSRIIFVILGQISKDFKE
jgi:hypothetical protein